MSIDIRRLAASDAQHIVDCFDRVYAGSYANPLFSDADQLALAITEERLFPVGAFTAGGTADGTADGVMVGHMAMTIKVRGGTPELGNTVVDPAARGAGVAWQVGDELVNWCAELGNTGFVHYPTTVHDIMQRQSLQRGHETGLMLGYIPADTDGQVGVAGTGLRQAATVVYQPISAGDEKSIYVPTALRDLILGFAYQCGLPRTVCMNETDSQLSECDVVVSCDDARGLGRMTINRSGADLAGHIEAFSEMEVPCRQVDLNMDDPNITSAYSQLRNSGFVFCAWLPGFLVSDVLRLQKPDLAVTNVDVGLVGETAIQLLSSMRKELADSPSAP